jgi:glucose/arabinose dehydrogenase
VAALALVVAAAGCTPEEPVDEPDSTPSPPAQAPSPPPPGAPAELTGEVEVVATGLDVPWDIDFLPDGTVLVTERTGRIVEVDPASGEITQTYRIDGVNPAGEGGLLGIAVSPDYDTDGTVFVYYTTTRDNRVARLTLGTQPEPILTGIPADRIHNGGRLAFGPDGHLYASTGDAAQPERSQDRDSLAGKILRMTPDGDPAPGNPFDSHVFAYGLRNVQGLAWDPGGNLWATEFGANEWDEINLIEPGNNYGWPEVEGPGGQPEYIDPEVAWRPPEASCSGAAVVGVTLVAACLRGQRLWLMDLSDTGSVVGDPQPLLVEEYGRLRAAAIAPDGSLWVTTSNHDSRLPTGPGPDDDLVLRLPVTGGNGGDQE